MIGNLLSDQPARPARTTSMVPPGMGELNYLQSLIAGVTNQELNTTSSPTFVGLTLSGLTASVPIVTNASKALASVTYAAFKASLAIAQADVTGLTTGSSPTFAGMTLTGLSGYVKATAGVLSAGAIGAGDLPAHVLDGAVHSVSGLTSGHFLKATGTTTFGFAAHGLTYSDVGAEASGAVATHAALITGVHGLVFTAGKALTLQKSMTLTAADDTGVYTFPTGTKTLLAADGLISALVIASQATGDLLYASSATAWARLGIGAAGKALVVNGAGTLPEWGTVLTNPMGAQGQLIYGGNAGAPTHLDAGTAGYMLETTGAAGSETPGWVACTGTGAPMRGTSPTITTSLIMSDGATIGQAAGPLVAFDDTNNNLEITGCSVIIGGATPSHLLHLQKDSADLLKLERITTADNYAAMVISNVSSGGAFDSGFGSKAESTLNNSYFYFTGDNSNIHFAITRLGKIGMGGITAPTTKLDILGATDVNNGILKLRSAGTDDNAGLTLFPAASGGNAGSRAWQIAANYNAYGNLDILRSTSAGGNPTTAVLSIDSAGNVGIGTATPTSPLQVKGLPTSAAGLSSGAFYLMYYAPGAAYVMAVT